MTTKPEELDAAGQRELALSMAPHFTLAEFTQATEKFGKLGGNDLIEIWRQVRNVDVRTGEEPKPPIRTFDKAADLVCPDCSQHFADGKAMSLHYSYDVPMGVGNGAVFNTPAEVAAAFPERRRCSNDQELLARGLKSDGTNSRIRDPRPDTWYC